MDIRSIASSYGAVGYDPGSKNNKKPDAPKTVKKSEEVVAFSDTSMNMQKVKEAAYKAPEIRIPIVEEIKKRIKNNEYPIDLKANSALDNLIRNKIV